MKGHVRILLVTVCLVLSLLVVGENQANAENNFWPDVFRSQNGDASHPDALMYVYWDQVGSNGYIGVNLSYMGCVPTCLAMIAEHYVLWNNTQDGLLPLYDVYPYPEYVWYALSCQRDTMDGGDIRIMRPPESKLPLKNKYGGLGGIRSDNPFSYNDPPMPYYDWGNMAPKAFMDPVSHARVSILFSRECSPTKEEIQDHLIWGGPDRFLVLTSKKRELNGTISRHAILAVGWDYITNSPLILDPAWSYVYFLNYLGGMPQSMDEVSTIGTGNWYGRIDVDMVYSMTTASYPVSNNLYLRGFSPIEILVTDPNGQRAGFDRANGTKTMEITHSSYGRDYLEGESDSSDPCKLLMIPSALDGRYRCEVIGTGTGPFTLGLRGYNVDSALNLDEEFSGSIVPGQVFKYEIVYSRTGEVSSVEQVSNFSPGALAGEDITVPDPGGPVTFNGGPSFDVDGNIVSYEWDFGDGTTASGANASHTYTEPGTYTATLTVTDNEGKTNTHTRQITVLHTPIVECGPDRTVSLVPEYGLFTFLNEVIATFTDPGGDSDHITYARVDWGDGSYDYFPSSYCTTCTNPLITQQHGQGTLTGDHGYQEPGTYTVTATITDTQGNTSSDSFNLTIIWTHDNPPLTPSDCTWTHDDNQTWITLQATDADNDPLTISVTQPLNGSASLVNDPSNPKVYYTPNPGFYGTDTFTYTADDGYGHTATGDISVTVVHADSYEHVGNIYPGGYSPEGLAITPEGDILVGDSYQHFIKKFSPDGTELNKIDLTPLKDETGDWIWPMGITVDSIGHIYLSNYEMISCVSRWSADGTALELVWGSGDLLNPMGITTDSADNIYVVHNNGVAKYQPGGGGTVENISTGVTDPGGGGTVDGPGGSVVWYADVKVNSKGVIYISDGEKVRKLNPDGTLSGYVGGYGCGEGQFKNVAGLAFDAQDNLYVADSVNKRVQRFDPDGNFVCVIALPWSQDRFWSPVSVAVAPDGTVYVGILHEMDLIEVFTPAKVNTPPTACPIIVNTTTQNPIISWTYYDADNDPQSEYEVQVWDGPGGTGVNMWNPPVDTGDSTSVGYTGSAFITGKTYYARVRLFDGTDWGEWCEIDFKIPCKCDVDNNGSVNVEDINKIQAARGKKNPLLDIDGDGTVTVNDARKCVTQCTKPNCAR